MKKLILALAVTTLAFNVPAPIILTISDLGNGQMQIVRPSQGTWIGRVTNVLQTTTDFASWTSIRTNISFDVGFTNIVQATNVMSFYRVYSNKS
jgi:hypothetical protein